MEDSGVNLERDLEVALVYRQGVIVGVVAAAVEVLQMIEEGLVLMRMKLESRIDVGD